MAVKWQPGHYIRATSARHIDKILTEPSFTGAERNYSWRSLEPSKAVDDGDYDFSDIDDDLTKLVANGKKLIIRIDTNGFKNCPVNPGDDGSFEDCLEVPDYIRDPGPRGYNGVVYGFRKGGDEDPRAAKAAIWRPGVFDRLASLIRALGARYDDNPNVVAIKFQETAMGIVENEGGVESGAMGRYLEALKERMRVTNSAFPQTPIFQNINFSGFRGDDIDYRVHLEFLREFTETVRDEKLGGIGCGDPTQPTPALPLFETFKNVIPLASDNQQSGNEDLKVFYRPDLRDVQRRSTVHMYDLIVDSLYREELGQSIGRHANYVSWHATDADVIQPDFPATTQPYEQVFSRPMDDLTPIDDQAPPDARVPVNRQVVAVIKDKEALNGFPNTDLPQIYSDAVPNTPPTITLTQPVDGQVFEAGTDLSVFVAASDSDGSVATVSLFVNDSLVRELTRSPYRWGNAGLDPDLVNLAVGTYRLRAVATDDDGDTSADSVTVTVEPDAPVTLSLSATTVSESVGQAMIQARLSAAAPDDVRFGVHTIPKTANRGEDFYGFSNTFLIPTGSLTLEIPVLVIDDDIIETDEHFDVRIYEATNATIGVQRAVVTISDNDGDSDPPTLSVNDQIVTEGDTASLSVVMSRASTTPVSLQLATSRGDAVNGDDYYGTYQTLTLEPGITQISATVQTVEDTIAEPEEFFNYRIFNAVGSDIGTADARVRIQDND